MFSGGVVSSTSDSSEESMSSSDMSSSYSWISWFVSQSGNEFLLELDEEYIRDNFNLYGLRPLFPDYDDALGMILDPDCPDEEDLEDSEYQDILKQASDLYGLIHARFAVSQRGLSMVKEKYLAGEYSTCPRLQCDSQRCLPIGIADKLGQGSVKAYCPMCEQVYSIVKHKTKEPLDGAWFGTSLPHMFLQTYPDLVPKAQLMEYVPKIFGFKVHNRASVVGTKIRNERLGIRQPRPVNPNMDLADVNSEDSA